MTPKEKAKELVDKMYATQGAEYGITEYEAKQCALIAVDEIFNSMLLVMIDDEQYWYDVKTEIIKL